MSEPVLASLSPRQRDCLALVGRNYKTKEIARMLSISPSTVDNHIRAALLILGLHDRDEAARQLIAAEARQDLPRQPPALDRVGTSPHAAATADGMLAWWPRWVPPVGGRPNDLGLTDRMIAIGQIVLLSALLFIVVTLLLAGFFRALS